MFGTQYYFCSMFCAENWIVVRVKLTMQFLWRCNFAIDCAVKMLLWKCTWCFLYILVFAFYMFKTVKVSVTAERNWGDVNLLSRVGFWLMLRKMCSFYKHPKDMIRIVDVGFLWPQHFNKIVRETTCDGCIACVTFFLHETSLLLVSLFYGKCYVTTPMVWLRPAGIKQKSPIQKNGYVFS